MGEMKSAFEKALERAEKLGKLSPEEIKQRKEAENTAIGKALAERYLEHGYSRVLKEESDRYTGDQKDIVSSAAIRRLVDAISLQNDELTERAMEGIRSLKGDARTLQVKNKILSLVTEYKEAERQAYERRQKENVLRGNELLTELAISGSAIGEVKLGASEALDEIQEELSSRFATRLQEIKKELLGLSLES